MSRRRYASSLRHSPQSECTEMMNENPRKTASTEGRMDSYSEQGGGAAVLSIWSCLRVYIQQRPYVRQRTNSSNIMLCILVASVIAFVNCARRSQTQAMPTLPGFFRSYKAHCANMHREHARWRYGNWLDEGNVGSEIWGKSLQSHDSRPFPCLSGGLNRER
jgi:hypothetical protein